MRLFNAGYSYSIVNRGIIIKLLMVPNGPQQGYWLKGNRADILCKMLHENPKIKQAIGDCMVKVKALSRLNKKRNGNISRY